MVEYLKALGAPASVGLMLSVLLYMGATIATNIWLSVWSDDQVRDSSGLPASGQTKYTRSSFRAIYRPFFLTW